MTATPKAHGFVAHTLDQLEIHDERSFRGVALYGELKDVVRRAAVKFRVLPQGGTARWDRALFFNLTFWGADGGGDVLVDASLEADVVAHVAWHHLASRALPRTDARPSVASLFLGEAIASAFDVYLVGRLLASAPGSSFLDGQVPAMAESAMAAGLDETSFEALLEGIAADPERAFRELRELLYDATMALFACQSAEQALDALSHFDAHRFASLLHHYELSNWVLYARAYGDAGVDPRTEAVDRALRTENDPLAWLSREWVAPAIA